MLFVFVVLLAVASSAPAAYFAHRSNRCAQGAAATALAAAQGAGQLSTFRKRVERNAAGPDTPDVHYCRHCGDAIARNAPGSAVPFLHIASTAAACPLLPGEPVTWAEPAMPDAWLREVSAADLQDVDETSVVLGCRCRNCRCLIEPSPASVGGHPWRHIGGGPACWIRGWSADEGTQIADEYAGMFAEPEIGPEPPPELAPTRPPLRAIPQPLGIPADVLTEVVEANARFAHTLGPIGDDL